MTQSLGIGMSVCRGCGELLNIMDNKIHECCPRNVYLYRISRASTEVLRDDFRKLTSQSWRFQEVGDQVAAQEHQDQADIVKKELELREQQKIISLAKEELIKKEKVKTEIEILYEQFMAEREISWKLKKDWEEQEKKVNELRNNIQNKCIHDWSDGGNRSMYTGAWTERLCKKCGKMSSYIFAAC